MKKRFYLILCATSFLFTLVSAAQERLSVAIGENKDIVLPFSIDRYKATPPGKIKIDSVSETKLRLTGVIKGECDLQISGGGISKTYSVSVVSNLKRVMKKLKNELQELSELDISDNLDVIIIRGTISNHEKWNHLQDVLSYYNKVEIRNFAKFMPTAETFLTLKKSLENEGYVFSDSENPEPGKFTMRISPSAVIIKGQVYSEGELEGIKNIIQASKYFLLDTEKVDEKSGKIVAILDIGVVKTQIAVDLAFVAINKKDVDTIGGMPKLQGSFNAKSLYDIIAGKATTKDVFFGGNISQTVQFLADIGISRIHRAGTVTFTNGAAEGGYLKVGGTHYITIESLGGGDVKEVNYGFIVSVKGNLLNRRQFNMILSLEDSAMESNVDKSEHSVRNSRIVDLDKTAIVGGYQNITRSFSKSGMPFLRNTPVIQWFVASNDESDTQSQMLVLACPRICNDSAEVQMEIPLTKQLAPVVNEAGMSNSEYKDNQKKKYSGWLYWLNWFVW